MNFLELRQQVAQNRFDANTLDSQIGQYINDANKMIARRVDYWVDETSETVNTTVGQTLIPFPTDFGRLRSIFDTNRNVELTNVLLRQLDRSNSTLQGAPLWYALQGGSVRIYPAADNVYSLELRYWKLPDDLVNDTDEPTLPDEYQRLLWYWAVAEGFAGEDDPQNAQYWEGRFERLLSEFMADERFINSDLSTQATSMWEQGQGIVQPGWSLYPWGW